MRVEASSELEPIAQLARQMELEVLDRELDKLPDRVRGPLVEHYLLGHTAPEIAERMELSVAAVEGRLKRGRRTLRSLLAKRGISLSVLIAGSGYFQQHVAAAEASQWTGNFVDQFLADSNVTTDTPIATTSNAIAQSPNVSSLVQGELAMFSTSLFKVATAASILIVAGTMVVFASDPFSQGQGGSSSPRAQSSNQQVGASNAITNQNGTGLNMRAPRAGTNGVGSGGQATFRNPSQNGGSQNSRANAGNSSDPFGGAAAANDPFGRSGMRSDDPFGGNANNSNVQANRAQNLGDPFGSGGGSGSNRGSARNASNTPAALADPFANSQSAPEAWQTPDNAEQPTWFQNGLGARAKMEEHRGTLVNEVDCDFQQLPLTDFASQFGEKIGIEISIRGDELELLGIDSDEPVNFAGTASIREVLRRTLTPLDLAYRVTESGIEITSADDAESNPSLRFYDLAYLFPNNKNADALLNAIEQSIEPLTWISNGGMNSVALVGSMLVVSATEPTHQKLELFLMSVSKMNPNNATPNTGFGGGRGKGGGMF